MKQTSSAITFLMAQYRAIFKHAYVKGLAAAVILTAGLAAGQAQAAATGWGASWAEATESVSGSGDITNSGDSYTNNFNVTADTTVSGDGRLIVKDSMTLSGATLTLSGGANTGIVGANIDPDTVTTGPGDGFALFEGATKTTFSANDAKINISGNGQSILFTNVTLTDTDVTIASGSGIGAEPGSKDENRTADRGQLSIDGGTYNLAEGAWLYGNNVNIAEGTVITAQSGAGTATSNIYAKSTGALNFAGTLNVESGGAAMLGGGAVNLKDGAVINSSGTLVLGNDYGQVTIEDGAEINHIAASDHMYAGDDIVMTGGTLNLNNSTGTSGPGLIGTEKPTADLQGNDFVYDLTATGGVISLNKSQIQMRNVTLGGDVEVTISGNIGDNSNSNFADNSQINAIGSGDTGVLTITGNADLTMGEASLLTANKLDLVGGSIELQGASGDYANDSGSGASGSAIIRGYGDGILNLAGTSLSVTKDHAGVLRSKDINLTVSTITNSGVLAIAGSVNNQSGGNTVVSGADFDMTGGSLNNAAGGVLHLGLDGVDNSGSVFTIAGGTFTNAGTTNVASGSNLTLTGTTTAAPTISNSGTISVTSGGTLTTAGTVTVGGTGTISLASGSTATLGGENVVLNGILDVASGASASITGKVTFKGDGKADTAVDLKVANKDNFTLATGGSLTIQDVAQTIGLTHTYGESGGTFAVSGGTFNGLNTTSAGTLYLDMEGVIKDASGAAITSMTQTEAEQYAAKLRATLGSGENFLLNLQGITINLGKEVDNALSSGNNSVDYGLVEDALASGLENDQLVNTSVNVSGTTAVQGSIGQITTDSNTIYAAGDQLKLNGYVPNSGDARPVLTQQGSGASATVAGIEMKAGSDVQANITEGFIGEVTTSAAGTGTFTVTAGSTVSVVQTGTSVSSLSADTAAPVGDIGSASTKINTVQATGSLTAGDVYSVNTNVVADTGSLNAANLTTEKANIHGQVNVTEDIIAQSADGSGEYNQAETATVTAKNLEADTANLAGQTSLTTMTAANATFDGGVHTISESLEVTESFNVTNGATLSLETGSIDAAQGLVVDGGANVVVQELTTSGDVFIGADTVAEGATTGAGSLSVTTMNLNGQRLVVDPAFGSKYSFAGVGTFADNTAQTDAGVLNGSAYALQNAILAIGETDEATVAQLFAQYIDAETQSLSANNVGAIAYVAQQLDIANGNKIVVDPTNTVDADGNFDDSAYVDSDIYLGGSGILAISVDAASNSDAAALQFASQDASITSSTNAKVVITGDFASADDLKLFADAGTDTDITISGANGLRIETLNGLLYKQFTDGESVGTIGLEDMSVDRTKVASAYTDTSSAVRHSILSYVTGDTQWDNTKAHSISETRIHGARVADVTYDNATSTFYRVNADGTQGTALTADEAKNLTFVTVEVNVPDTSAEGAQGQTRATQTEYLVYEKANNPLLTAIREQTETRGAAADSAAHMAEFGGAAQVALKAGAATTDAIAGRMGMGAANNAITYANNGQGAGIWVTPIYMSADSDGFDAQGVDYGTDISLYGVALGGDYTLANGVRVGAMFNVGSGDADGQGAGSAVTSDFDYYGLGLYAGYSFGQFSVVGDISYTSVDNDIEAGSGFDTIGTMKTSLDSTNLSIGVTGSYAFESASGVKVTPHVGLRYSNIDLDDYTVESSAGTIGSYDSDSLSVFSIPVGVTVATEFTTGTWSIKPSFDVTITGQFGDDEAEGTFKWAGVENIDSHLNSEIFDSFTYGATLGVAAQSASGISLGLAVGYTGSSNTDDLGVSANARFTF